MLRGLGAQAAQDWRALAASDFFPRRSWPRARSARTERGRPAPEARRTGWACVLRHERIPFVSYPYEWSFAMLRDAALLHLDLLPDGARRRASP